MGVERAVTRWYARRQTILNEIALLESQLDSLSGQAQESIVEASSQVPANIAENIALVDLPSQLTKAQEKLRNLGPCPKPMMG